MCSLKELLIVNLIIAILTLLLCWLITTECWYEDAYKHHAAHYEIGADGQNHFVWNTNNIQ